MNNGQTLRLALLGCGRMGRKRAAALAALGERFELVYDVDREAAVALAGESGRVLEGPEELAGAELDALFVCTPPGARGSTELDCLARGVPVFIEKPLGLDAESAGRWVRARGDRRTVAAVGYMNRHRASVRAAREVAREEGLVGLAGIWACGPYPRDWWRDERLSGGPLNEQMTHMIDLMRFLGGDVEVVAGLGSGAETDPARASGTGVALRFTSGAVGSLLYTCSSVEKGIGLRLVTPQRTLALEGWDFRSPTLTGAEDVEEDVFLEETRSFLTAVGGRQPSPALADIEEALATQRTVDAVKRSLGGGGHPVELG